MPEKIQLNRETVSLRKNPSALAFADLEGRRRLETATHKRSFYALVQNYQPQINKFFCGIASAVIVLNTVHRASLFSQSTFLNRKTGKIKPRREICKPDGGVTSGELAQLLELNGAQAEVHACEQPVRWGMPKFKRDLIRCLSSDDSYLITNFDSNQLIQSGKGHFSPVAAYDPSTETVLIMDTGRHRTEWFWTPVSELYRAMNTRDGDLWRGYLIVKK